jgi:hypothetical protein
MMKSAENALSDLVPLLYRARWLRSSLSGDVRSRRRRGGDEGHDELSGSLLAAPGGRYRTDLTDEDGDRQLRISDGRPAIVPFPELLIPSWLLAGFELEITGQAEHIGRAAYAVAGRPRQAAEEPASRVSALVDAELGVLLRYEQTGPRWRAETAEFTSLTVDDAETADPLLFTRAPASHLEDRNQPERSGPPAPAGPVPAATSPDLSDGQVNLLYRSVLGPQKFSAELHEWADLDTVTRLGQAALAATRLGSRTRWLWQSPEDSPPQNIDRAARLHVAMPGCYRIDTLTDPGTKPASVACDGNRLWLVYPGRIVVRPAAPPPAGISLLIDPAWLLNEHPLSTSETATGSGRPALRVMTTLTHRSAARGPLSGITIPADQVEAFIDLQLGIALTQIWYLEGSPVLRTELDIVTPDVDPAGFRIEPPPGIPVITGGLLAEAGLSPAGAAWTAVRGTAKLATEIGKRWARKPHP